MSYLDDVFPSETYWPGMGNDLAGKPNYGKASKKQLKAAKSFYGWKHGSAINKPYPLGKFGQKVADKWAHGLKQGGKRGFGGFPTRADKILAIASESGWAREYEFNADLEIKSKFLKSKASKG